MPVADQQALQHIEITVLRQLGDNIAAQTRHLETLTGKVDDVRERLARIEGQNVEKQVDALNKGLKEQADAHNKQLTELSEALSKRVTELEAQRNRVGGVAALGAWLVQAAPWVIAAGASIAYIKGLIHP